MNELIKQVEQWSIDKDLNKGNSHVQHTKMTEEVGEVSAALCRNNIDELRDGIGDVVVTLIILAQQNDMDLYECLNAAYEEIKDRKGKTNADGTFIKESDL
ncbi:MazG-like family protein [Staphylococcus nepalensis]|uniref:MazG-like family protein n=1 Tax=Staphylococcus nepalensis TaxID=214473 RepID=UPI0030196B23